MDALYSVSQTLRRVLGIFIPGLAWLLLLYLAYFDRLTPPITGLLRDAVLLPAMLLLLSYVIGALNLMVAFRLLGIVGDLTDLVVRRLARRIRFIRRSVALVSRYLHVLDLDPLEDERRDLCPLTEAEQVELGRYANLSDVCKMRLQADSPELAKPVLEVEAEINYHAGMYLPILALGLGLWVHSQWASSLVIMLAMWHALRYQHLRHHDVMQTYLAYRILQRRASPAS